MQPYRSVPWRLKRLCRLALRLLFSLVNFAKEGVEWLKTRRGQKQVPKKMIHSSLSDDVLDEVCREDAILFIQTSASTAVGGDSVGGFSFKGIYLFRVLLVSDCITTSRSTTQLKAFARTSRSLYRLTLLRDAVRHSQCNSQHEMQRVFIEEYKNAQFNPRAHRSVSLKFAPQIKIPLLRFFSLLSWKYL